MTRRIAFAVGDTAGHVNLAVAVADAYREHFEDVDALFLAASLGRAPRLVTEAGYRLALVPGRPMACTGWLGKAAGLASVTPCFVAARKLLRDHDSRLVVGSGSYASVGVIGAARSLGLRTAIIEPNVELGLANRFLRPLADRSYCAFADTAQKFRHDHVLITGTPVRPALESHFATYRRHGYGAPPIRVFVTGGSRGDTFLATHVPPLLATVHQTTVPLEVVHQVDGAASSLQSTYAQLGVPARVTDHIADLRDTYEWASLVICRGGASTLAELALAALPSFIVPLGDAAADHQRSNVIRYAANGAACWTTERAWRPETLARDLGELLADPCALARMSVAARANAEFNAAAKAVSDCDALMANRW